MPLRLFYSLEFMIILETRSIDIFGYYLFQAQTLSLNA